MMPQPAHTAYVEFRYMGLTPYQKVWDEQRRLFGRVLDGSAPNTVLLCQHPDVITLGRNTQGDGNLRATRAQLASDGYEIFDVDRGGDVTYHGPGQLVGYPILRLEQFRTDLGWYIRSVEELIIRAVALSGIRSGRKQGMTGVWVNDKKLCAIGVRASRWVTMHGFALNVTTDLNRFDAIIPCGIAGCQVTSIAQETGEACPVEHIAANVIACWQDVFGREMKKSP